MSEPWMRTQSKLEFLGQILRKSAFKALDRITEITAVTR